MGKKEFLKQINSLREILMEHETKIHAEQQKAMPDFNRINYWLREIKAFKNAIGKAEKRLKRGK